MGGEDAREKEKCNGRGAQRRKEERKGDGRKGRGDGRGELRDGEEERR